MTNNIYTLINFTLQLPSLNITHQSEQKSYLNNGNKSDLCCDFEEITTDVSTEEEDAMATIKELRSTCRYLLNVLSLIKTLK